MYSYLKIEQVNHIYVYTYYTYIYTYIHFISFAEVVLELNCFHLFAFTETKVGKNKGREVRRYSPFLRTF